MSSARKQKISFTDLEVRTEPFDHFFIPKAFDEEKSLIILNWLQTKAPWKLVTENFYTQYEFDFKDAAYFGEDEQDFRELFELDFAFNLNASHL